ncbi:hypothetical protein CGSMWGv00703C2mash_05356 [Gardnerella pickettii 00703C2mash]|nr:hypothetical protein CGSMWGv00703C2mash_05356 [Gardnerella pickettii 00703C2mash]
MNKKAIAAFAAGATLLAGFAMATPAFAADAPKAPEAAKTTADLKKQYEDAKTALEKMTKPAKDAPAAPATPAGVADAVEADAAAGEGMLKLKATTKSDTTNADLYNAAVAYRDSVNNYYKDKKAYEAKQTEVNTLHAQYLASLEKDANTPKGEDPADADYTAALQAASTKLKAADKNVRDAFAKADKLYKELKAAKAKASAAAKAVTDFKNEHDDMSKRDQATLGRLQKAQEDADAAVTKLEGKVSDAKGKYDEAFGKYDVAFGAYEKAYGDAKNHKESLVLGFVAPETAKLLRSDFQYGVGFVGSSDPFVAPGAPAGQPGKPGAPAAGANGAAGKAGAKTEVENKKDKDKRGNTHTGTGVGVTLTALAATMLAGMGAAVRKARH